MPLIDPESARITRIEANGPRRWSFPGRSISGQQVTFWLNAKNRMGGYTGPKRFLVILTPSGDFKVREATERQRGANQDHLTNLDRPAKPARLIGQWAEGDLFPIAG
jgi:hypothetical protein